MDRFKFRAWHTITKKMAYVENIEFLIGSACIKFHDEVDSSWHSFSRLELIQCTGLKDKNGRLIFESDILKFNGSGWSPSDGITIAVVKFGDDDDNKTIGFYVDSCFRDFSYSDKEVIGNIYENSDLIPKKEI